MDVNKAIEEVRQGLDVFPFEPYRDAMDTFLADHARLQQRAAEPTVRELQETLREFNAALGCSGYEQFGMHDRLFVFWRKESPDRRSMDTFCIEDPTPAGFIAKVRAKTAELLEAKEKV